MTRDNSIYTAGLVAAFVIGSAGISASTAIAAERHHGQWSEDQQQSQGQQTQGQDNERQQNRRDQRPQRESGWRNNEHQNQAQQRAPERTYRQDADRRQNQERDYIRQESAQRQRAQREDAQRQQAQRQQDQRQQDQRDSRHNDANRRYMTQSQPQWHDDHRDRYQTTRRYDGDQYNRSHREVRNAQWNHWQERHYVSEPRYHWSHDRYSRPWFDYGRFAYIPIYRPSYVIPQYGYGSYGSSYYGPVGCGRDVVGAVLGGVAGGMIGAHNGGGGATLGGAIIGALLGGTLGHAIDLSDQACYGQVLEYVPSDQPVYWESDGVQYQVTPLRTYQASSGEYCREYETYIYIDGREEQAYGSACRQPDGAWRAAN